MSEILDRAIVLSLNRNWERIGWLTVRQAIIAMTGGNGPIRPAVAIPVEPNESGGYDINSPVEWDEWVKLPVKPSDLSIQTSSGPIRVPVVVIRPGYSKMPIKRPKLTKQAILERDGYVCQYTGEKLSRSELNVDHVIPRDKGGKDVWENLVASRKDLNTKKGNRFNHEVGYKLKKQPHAPKPAPVSFFIREGKLPEHAPFFSKG